MSAEEKPPPPPPARDAKPFTITLSGNLAVEARDGVMTIALEIEGEGDNPPPAEFPLSLGQFAGPDTLHTFLHSVDENFHRMLRTALVSETILHLADVIYFAGLAAGLESGGKQEIISSHLRRTAERLTSWLREAPEKPRGSPWTRAALVNAARLAVMSIVKRKGRVTLTAVADEIRSHHGDAAPASGEALRKLLDRFEVDWRALKADTQKAFKVLFS